MQMQTSLRQPATRPPHGRIPQALRPRVSRPVGSALDLGGHMDIMGAPMSFSRNTEIYGENEPADYLYKVVSGCVRTYKIFDDGRRQIGGFYEELLTIG